MALLADLAVAGAIKVCGDGVSRTGQPVHGDADLTELADRIADRPGKTPEYWALQLYAGKPERSRLASLRRQNLILEYEYQARLLWWSSTVRRQLVREDDAVITLTVQRISRALGGGEADEATIALLAIVHACGLHRAYFKNFDRRQREQRISHLVGGHWAGRATRQCLDVVTVIV